MKKKQGKKIIEDEIISEVDYSEGFGGIPKNLSLTKNIGCASDSNQKFLIDYGNGACDKTASVTHNGKTIPINFE